MFICSSICFGYGVPSALQKLCESDLHGFGLEIDSTVTCTSISLDGRVWREKSRLQATSYCPKGECGCKAAEIVAGARNEDDTGLI